MTWEQAWSNDALTATLNAYYGVGADADLPSEVRFLRSVITLARKRFETALEDPSSSAIIFLLHPERPFCIQEHSHRNVSMLDNGLQQIGNRVWFVNHLANEGVGVELLPDSDDYENFEEIRNHFGLGSAPAVVIETRGGLFEARHFSAGLSHMEKCETISLKRSAVTPIKVQAALEKIYRDELCTPDAQQLGSAWENPAKHLAKSDAEQKIQHIIKIGLSSRFPHCVVLPEQPGVSGRLDLVIEEPDVIDEHVFTRPMLLELKVLREKSESGSTKYSPAQTTEIVRKGIAQAANYRVERRAHVAALCCYDMRPKYSGDSVFDDHTQLAADNDVLLWAWHLFGSSDAFRKHQIGA